MQNDCKHQPFEIEEAVTKKGLLLTLGSAARKFKLCDAGEEPHGYAFVTTYERVSNTYKEDVISTVSALVEGDEIEVPLKDGETIAFKDSLETADNGEVAKLAGAGWVVGQALQASVSGTGRFIQIRVSKKYQST